MVPRENVKENDRLMDLNTHLNSTSQLWLIFASCWVLFAHSQKYNIKKNCPSLNFFADDEGKNG